ncbi:protein FAR1-RELATED SEQUENCE 5-like [Salvia splendens]|uniref:protein FAR1-RELATED SEQUENCE 5-like n=1 Tax=Salvia splendens TaxID=180675 RepID=UPI001C251E9F|nr:protein FAR1-RELATED SEQUENCE 5-like [Salvia splendens]
MGLLFTLLFLSPLFLLSPASAAELNTTHRALIGAANCNIFRSKWVYDASYPLYDFSSCPVIDDQLNCLKYRRPDQNYLKYRWKPFSCNLARCDPTVKRNYHLYGDIVSFDKTYSTNRYCMIFAPFTGKDNHGRPVTFAVGLLSKENVNSFSWLFNQFVKCMVVAPKLIVTDQDLRMKVAIEEVLVNTRHRWCMWHVMNKVADKLPKNMLGSEELKKELNACVWSELIEPDAFE